LVVTTLLMALGGCGLHTFSQPHPDRTVAEWLSLVVGAGESVAVEDWHPGLARSMDKLLVRRIELPSSRLVEGEVGRPTWLSGLAAADWVVLGADRLRQAGDETAIDAPPYDVVLGDASGLVPLTRSRRPPRFLGLELPSGSDTGGRLAAVFPELVVFRRVAVMGESDGARVAAGRDDLKRLGRLPTIEPVPGAARQMVDLMTWVTLVLGLGLVSWVLVLPLTADLPDAGAGLALTTGWIGPAWMLWLGSELGIVRVGADTATWIVVILTIIAAGVARRRRALILRAWSERRTGMVLVVVAAVAVGLLFLAVRAVNPAIADGEKPMDFSFLNAFVNSASWPTGEPWMAGKILHYYYFGEVLSAFPVLVCGCRTSVGYNLMAATVPALAAALLVSIGLVLARGRRAAAMIIPLLVLLSGNLAWPKMLARLDTGGLFNLWWATSRVIPSPYAIEEFPLWTAVFADLHGHFVALPVLLAGWMWAWTVVRAPAGRWPAAAVLAGVCAGVLAGTNPWDLVVFTGALGLAVLATARRPARAVGRLAVAAVVSVLAVGPFVAELVSGIDAGAGGGGELYPTTGDFAPWWALALHFGLFLAPLTAGAAARSGRMVWLGVVAATALAAVGLVHGSSGAALALACAGFFAVAQRRTTELAPRLAWTLALAGVLLVAACEVVTVVDRMNTVFKIYNGVWVVLALALGMLVATDKGRCRRVVVSVWLPLQLVAMVNLPLGIAQAWADPLVPSPRPTLDGQAYLANGRLEDWSLIRIVEAVSDPGSTVAEAAGEGYSRAVRIAMHTGRPTVVGWPWHLEQRGQSPAEIRERREALVELYGGDDPLVRRGVIERFAVEWIVVGRLERATYGVTDADPFEDVPGVTPIATPGRSVVYRAD
jgi:YYY domain-containing protein